jgi:hypothetical protein
MTAPEASLGALTAAAASSAREQKLLLLRACGHRGAKQMLRSFRASPMRRQASA